MMTAQEAELRSERALLRSLLQKAVRRGASELAISVANLLASRGDAAWLKTRIGIIAFEECWPYSRHLLTAPPFSALQKISSSIKNKEAAGLGSLAFALSQGDSTVSALAPDPIAVKIVAASLTRTTDYFSWLKRIAVTEEQLSMIDAAQFYFYKASWPWDKAFAAAGAFLMSKNSTMFSSHSGADSSSNFPYWVAIDKHTFQGRLAIRMEATRLLVSFEKLEWVSFYCESSTCDSISPGVWWEAEISWRLGKFNITRKEAEQLWNVARNGVKNTVSPSARKLVEILSSSRKTTLGDHEPSV